MQSEEKIKSLMLSYIEDSKNNLSKENPKFDFKRKWYDLKDEKDILEFLKDTSSIANTVGLDGYILLGFDDKTKCLTNTKFSDSGLRDTQHLNGIIIKHVSPAYTLSCIDIIVEGHSCSVLHMPPSLDKPHCIKNYRTFDKLGNVKNEFKNTIFIRRGSSTEFATRYELDVMYYDRKNLEPEYSPFVFLTGATIHTGTASSYSLQFQCSVIIENAGRRPLTIKSMMFEIENPFKNGKTTSFTAEHNLEEKINSNIVTNNLIINPFQSAKFTALIFKFENPNINNDINDTRNQIVARMGFLQSCPLNINLTNGKSISTTLNFSF